MHTTRIYPLLVLSLALGGCSKNEQPPAPSSSTPVDPIGSTARPFAPPHDESLPVASVAEPTPPAPAEAPTVAVDDTAGTPGRPSGTPTAEAAFDALARAGIHLGERKHLVASVFGARYCLTSKADDGTAFSVCEYESEDAARAGKDKALAMLGTAPGKTASVKAKTMLVIRPANLTAASSMQNTSVALRAFSAL